MPEGGLPISDPVSPTVAEDLPQTSTVPIELIREAVRGVMVEMFPGSQPQQVSEPTTGECQGGGYSRLHGLSVLGGICPGGVDEIILPITLPG